MHLLGALSLHPRAGVAELSEILVLARSTLVRNLKLLERDGLVVASRPASSRAQRFDVPDAQRRPFPRYTPHRVPVTHTQPVVSLSGQLPEGGGGTALRTARVGRKS